MFVLCIFSATKSFSHPNNLLYRSVFQIHAANMENSLTCANGMGEIFCFEKRWVSNQILRVTFILSVASRFTGHLAASQPILLARQ